MTARFTTGFSSMLLVGLLVGVSAPALASTSVFATAPVDPRAITVAARGDGVTDDLSLIHI